MTMKVSIISWQLCGKAVFNWGERINYFHIWSSWYGIYTMPVYEPWYEWPNTYPTVDDQCCIIFCFCLKIKWNVELLKILFMSYFVNITPRLDLRVGFPYHNCVFNTEVNKDLGNLPRMIIIRNLIHFCASCLHEKTHSHNVFLKVMGEIQHQYCIWRSLN